MKTNSRASAVVRDYDSSTATGHVEIGGQNVAFTVTSFFSEPPNRSPRLGEAVEVVFQKDSSNAILAVLSVPKKQA